ncbi:MAG: universal stress protein [Chloroflexota bacterium]
MYQRILVPLDGSRAAEVVLPYAEEIVTKTGAEIILVSVSETKTTDIDHLYRSYLERVTEQVHDRLKSYGAKETKVRTKVLIGKPANEIVSCADENDVDLIALASHGGSAQGSWLLGAIAGRVLRVAARPVLLVRTPASATARKEKRLVKKILVPLDGSKAGESALPCLEMLAPSLGAELVLFQVVRPITVWAGVEGGAAYVVPQDEDTLKSSALEYLNGIGKQLQEKGLRTSSIVVLGAPAEQILDYAASNTIDLIAMATHGRSGIGRWVFGSVTDKILHAGDTAVLVVRSVKT